jgi:WhiB family transcriptional regulator, redox-sensing transcriptional regulator
MRALAVLPPAPEWQNRANCKGTDPDEFFPDAGGSGTQAKRICRRCEVTTECLNAAIERDEKFGVFGGMTRNERKRYAKRAARMEAKAA